MAWLSRHLWPTILNIKKGFYLLHSAIIGYAVKQKIINLQLFIKPTRSVRPNP
jgi:hypothetical protein